MSAFVTISNDDGLRAVLSPYGATLVSVEFPDKNGRTVDCVLGYEDEQGYRNDVAYLGRTVGRICNRIRNGQFEFQGKQIQLPINRPPHNLHGGSNGTALRTWDVTSHSPFSVTFHIDVDESIDGFPGDASIDVTYTVNDRQQLVVEHSATCTKDTVLSLTNHAYWNLDGSDSIAAHRIIVHAHEYLPIDETNCPNGAQLPVKDTRFDLTSEQPLSSLAGDDGLVDIDNDFVLDPEAHPGSQALSLSSDVSGIRLEVATSYPCVHLYGAKFLNNTGKHNVPYGANKGLAIEAQIHSGALNYCHFPSVTLSPGETYAHEIVYSLSHL